MIGQEGRSIGIGSRRSKQRESCAMVSVPCLTSKYNCHVHVLAASSSASTEQSISEWMVYNSLDKHMPCTLSSYQQGYKRRRHLKKKEGGSSPIILRALIKFSVIAYTSPQGPFHASSLTSIVFFLYFTIFVTKENYTKYKME